MDMIKNLNGIMLNRYLVLFCFLFVSCSTSGHFTDVGKKEFTSKIYFPNPTVYTILLNRYLVYRSKVPDEGLAKHNAAIHTALMNPKNGVIYAWKHVKTSTWPDQVFVGKLKIIYTSLDRRGICRTWLEEITRDNKFQSLTMSTACLNNKRTKYILADWNFYDQIK